MLKERTSLLQRLESKYAWGVFSAVIGILGIALALLALREKRAQVS